MANCSDPKCMKCSTTPICKFGRRCPKCNIKPTKYPEKFKWQRDIPK